LRTRWLTVGIVLGVGLLVACVLWLPQLILTADVGRDCVATMNAEAAAKAINDVRATLLQGIGGGVLLLGASSPGSSCARPGKGSSPSATPTRSTSSTPQRRFLYGSAAYTRWSASPAILVSTTA
jgi:hypothetical protein